MPLQERRGPGENEVERTGKTKVKKGMTCLAVDEAHKAIFRHSLGLTERTLIGLDSEQRYLNFYVHGAPSRILYNGDLTITWNGLVQKEQAGRKKLM